MRPVLKKEVLQHQAFRNFTPALIKLDYTSVQTLLTHHIRPLDTGRYVVGDRIHPRMNLNVTDTGRLSRSKPATQNITEDLRDIIIPEDGEEYLTWDFSQIEMREAAYQWNDKNMQAIFAAGGDVYDGVVDLLARDGVGHLLGADSKLARKTAKTIALTVNYLGDEHTIWEKQRIPRENGRRLLDSYFANFPGIKDGIERTTKFALENGYTETRLGRRRDESEGLESGYKPHRERAIRELVNHTIQGTCAEYMKQALIVCCDAGYPVTHTVHDEGNWSQPSNIDFEGLPKSVTPYDAPVTIKRGANWRDVKEVGI